MLSRIYEQEAFDLVNAVGSPSSDFWIRAQNYQKVVHRAPSMERLRTLKFRFSAKLITLVFSFEKENLQLVDRILRYNTNTRILFISPNTSSVRRIVLDRIRDMKYSRAVFLDSTSLNYETFEFFPSFKAISKTFLRNESLIFVNRELNLHRFEIRVGHVENPPRGMKYYDSEGNLQLLGYVATMLKVFCERINGTFAPVLIEDSEKFSDTEMLDHGEIDFITTYYNFASRNRSKFYENLQNVSETLELVEMTIITPSPNEIPEKYYTIKPFGWRIWLTIFVLCLYSSGLVSIISKKTSQYGDFGYFLGIVQRAFIGFAFQYPKSNPFKAMKIFYMLLILFGFIINVFYSALLGSFLVAQLSEDPINTVEDFKQNQKYIILPLADYRVIETVFDMNYFESVFQLVDRPYFRYQKNILNTSYSYVEKTDHWKYFSYPLMDFHNDFRFHLTQIKLNVFNFYLNMNADSLYKDKLNRFIYLIRDVGLYQFWCRDAFLDNMRYKLYPYSYSYKDYSIVDPLDLDYFEWIFSAFLGALTVSSLVFAAEVAFEKWRIRIRESKKVFNINFYF